MPIKFSGIVIPLRNHHLLVYGPEAEALGAPLFGPPVYLRPGYRFVTRNEYLLPTEVIDDIGQHFLAPDCYAWIEMRGDAFPRADAIGMLPSGEKMGVFMKELDLAVMAVFVVARPGGGSPIRVDLAIEALATPDGYAVTPIPCAAPLELFARALPCYRLAPGVFGAVGAAIINQLLANPHRNLRLTFDDVDDWVAEG